MGEKIVLTIDDSRKKYNEMIDLIFSKDPNGKKSLPETKSPVVLPGKADKGK